MLRSRRIQAVSLLFAVVAVACRPAPRGEADTGAAAAAAPAPLTDADRAAIRANDSLFSAACSAGDIDGVVSAYAADASLLPPNAPTVKGAEGIRAFWGGFMAAYDVKMEVAGDEVAGAGDLAYVVGRYNFTATPKAKGPALEDRGKFVEIYKRQADGSWKYAVDIYNSDLPAH